MPAEAGGDEVSRGCTDDGEAWLEAATEPARGGEVDVAGKVAGDGGGGAVGVRSGGLGRDGVPRLVSRASQARAGGGSYGDLGFCGGSPSRRARRAGAEMGFSGGPLGSTDAMDRTSTTAATSSISGVT